jgi:hypothetical protein
MTVAVGVAGVAGGLEAEPSAAHLASGSQAGSLPKAASFQSSWQSMIAALGEEMSTGGAQKPQPGTTQDASLPLPVKVVQQPLPAASETDAAQASLARFRLDRLALNQDVLPERESSAAAGAASQSKPGTGLENSEGSDKPIKHQTSAQNASETKHAAADSANTQNPSQPSVAVPLPIALPQLPQQANATAAQHAQSFLTDASPDALHRTAPGLTNGIAASSAALKASANGIANGASLDGNSAGIAQSASSAGEARGASGHAQSADAHPSTAGAPLTPAAPADAAALNANADAASTDPISDSIRDADSASIGYSIGSDGAAHTIAAQDKRAGEPIAERAEQRSAHEASDAALGSLQSHAPQVQPAGTAGDSSAFARDAAAGHGAANTLPSGSLGSAGAAPGSRETFAALDADAAHGASWLHAGAHSAEAGFEDPALGWVSVRADMAAGVVHAAVVPGTAEAAQALGSHMAGLNSYLSEQRAPVHTLTLSAPGGDAASNQGTGQGSGQDSAYRDGPGQQPAQQSLAQPNIPASRTIAPAALPAIEHAPAAARAGASISLIA